MMVQATFTGMAFSINSPTIDSSKKATIALIHRILSEIKLDDMNFIDLYYLSNIGIDEIMINEQNINIWLEGNKLILEASQFQVHFQSRF